MEPFLGDPVTGEAYRPPGYHYKQPDRMEDKLDTALLRLHRLEAKLDALIEAAGALSMACRANQHAECFDQFCPCACHAREGA